MKIPNPTCPKCGEPPRYAEGKFIILVNLERTKEPLIFQTGKCRRIVTTEDIVTVVCGGGHRWKVTPEITEGYDEEEM